MNGKIFSESHNLYEDQAKILFDFYRQAAEKIVKEEEQYEGEIEKLSSEKKNTDLILASAWQKIKLWFQGNLKKTRLHSDSLSARIKEFQKLHKEIFRDYKVNKLGVVYVPVAEQFKYNDKSFIVDYSGMVPESEVKLQVSRQNDLFMSTISDLEKLTKEAPIVETSHEPEEIDTEKYSRSMQHINQHDYFGKLERSLRTISYCMDDMDVTTVSLPLVENNSPYINFLNEYATSDLPANALVFEAFDKSKKEEQISKFRKLNEEKDSMSKSSEQFEDVLKSLMKNMANSVQTISALKVASSDKMVFEANKTLFKILKSPYNHYSPILESEEIERIKNETFNYGDTVADYVPFHLKDSSRVKYNIISGMWVAEDGSNTTFPFGVHQIQEEIVVPIVQNLLTETRIERMKIYNHIKDQKIDYLNKWHQDTEDFYGRNRSESADLINLMRASLRDYVASYNTLASLKKTEESMTNSDANLDTTVVKATSNSAEVLAAFNQQSEEFQKVQLDFENYMERLKEDIDLKAEKFEYIEYYDASLRDRNSKEIAVATSEIHDFDARRKSLVQINPLFAKESELPPEPNIENIMFEHISLNLPTIAQNTLDQLTKNAAQNTDERFSQESIQEDIKKQSQEEHPESPDGATENDKLQGEAHNLTSETNETVSEGFSDSNKDVLDSLDETEEGNAGNKEDDDQLL